MILLFAFDNYYPMGGMDDLIAIAPDLETAERFLVDYKCGENAHAWDSDLLIPVKFWSRSRDPVAWDLGPWKEKEDWYADYRKPITDLR